MKILVVDDDKICRRVNCGTLRRSGYDTVEAGGVKEAFDLIDKGEPIVLIMTDVKMPDTDGLDFVARLRRDPGLSKIPIVICTSLETKEWLEQAEMLGVSAYSPKPVNANHLRGKIGQILQEEPWPLEEIFRSLMRLDISVEDYFGCLNDLIQQLNEVIARSLNDAQPMSRAELKLELDALAGAAENLGAQRICGVLNGEVEAVESLADSQKVAVSSALKRETGMLELATLILKKENEESIAARSAGRVVPRQAGKDARWKTAFVSKQPEPDTPPASSSEPAIPAESPEPAIPAQSPVENVSTPEAK